MVLDKDDIRYISQNINPEEAQYVMGVSTILNDVGNEYKARVSSNEYSHDDYKEGNEKYMQEDILMINKLLAYSNKFLNCTYACKSDNYKYKIQDFQWSIKDTIDNCMKILSVKYGQNTNLIYNLEIPSNSDPLVLLNDLKEQVFDYIAKCEYADGAENYVLGKFLEEFLKRICSAIYDFRLAKSSEYNPDDNKAPNY